MAQEIIVLPENARWGPEMEALNERQQKFVVAMLELGTMNHSRCARAAGYEGTDESLKVQAYRLAHDQKVLAAIEAEARRRLKSGAIMAVSTLLTIADSSTTATKDRLKAIEMVLNRSGLPAQTEHKVDVVHRVDDIDAIERVKQLSKKLGLDATKLLGGIGIIDGEYEEVDPNEFDPEND